MTHPETGHMPTPVSDCRKVAVVIPCYNEAASIAKVIAGFDTAQFDRQQLALQIYVIDNNSTDGTAKVAARAGAQVIREPKQGKGHAIKTGFLQLPADVDYVVMLDGDDTYSPGEINRMLEPLEHGFCDVVVGSRLGGRIQRAAMSHRNLLGNRLFTLGVRLLYKANVSDVLTGYFAWKKPVLDTLGTYITSPGFAVEMEMITKMARLGYQMASVPISYHPRKGSSSLHPWKDGLRILAMLLKNLVWNVQYASRPATTPDNDVGVTTKKKEDSGSRPRKIVFVSDAIYPYMKGGKEKRLYEISKRLAAMGNEVHIYTMHWWDSPSKTKVEDGLYLHALCKRHNMYHGNRRTISEAFFFGLACFKLFRLKFDVLDVDHMPFLPLFSTWLVCVVRRRKLYATWHEALSAEEWVGYMGRGGRVAALLERLSTHLPNYITAASKHTQESLAKLHGRMQGVELVASGVDTALIKSVRPADVNCDVLYIGRLVKDKHVDELIRAVGILAKTRPQLRCIIIGNGPEKTRLKRLAASQKLQQQISFFAPLKQDQEVYGYMKAASVFCSPSTREGFGITVLEALACNTPVVTTNNAQNAARHLVHDGQNGSVVALNPEELAIALGYWLGVARPMAIAQDIATDHDWWHLARKQAEVYSQ